MNQSGRCGVMRVVFSLLSLYSMNIYAVVLTAVLYTLKVCTNFDIQMDSVFQAFVFVAVVTMLNPLTFLIELSIRVIGEFVSFIPKVIFSFISKITECLLLIWLVGKVDMAVDGVHLSLHAQIAFAFTVYIVTSILTGEKNPVTKNK
ncbi:hypothetical protein SMD22_02135 (plasmid) [Brevibacillus halotolerans]|nr:hypothetical protein SMD22_02135 [Brevibacillus halotolerans]